MQLGSLRITSRAFCRRAEPVDPRRALHRPSRSSSRGAPRAFQRRSAPSPSRDEGVFCPTWPGRRRAHPSEPQAGPTPPHNIGSEGLTNGAVRRVPGCMGCASRSHSPNARISARQSTSPCAAADGHQDKPRTMRSQVERTKTAKLCSPGDLQYLGPGLNGRVNC
jgi:hypothetical protein